jgi:hypothetical protein
MKIPVGKEPVVETRQEHKAQVRYVVVCSLLPFYQ